MALFPSWRSHFGSALFLASFSGAAYAQNATISGRLLDGATQQPVPFATVVLLRAGADSAVATGGQTDAAGAFRLSGLAAGPYRLRASAVGYATLRRPVTLTGAEQALGDLSLTSVSAQLGEVQVEGRQAVVQDGLDKRVINVAQDLTSVGGTAVNVLQNVPSVQVDQNGQVSLRGTQNVTIWINGKPSGAAVNGTDALSRIPASSIEKVEVITNPSARYDAANSGGIINIILKKPKENGTNGTLSANVGTRDKQNGQFSVNRKQGNWNLFAEYSYGREHFHNDWQLNQATIFENQTENLRQRQLQGQIFTNHIARAGFDFTPSPDHTFSLSVQPVVNKWNFAERVEVDLTRPDTALRYAGRNATELNIYSVDLSADYRRTWAAHPGRTLTAAALYTPSTGDQRLDQEVGGPFQRQLIAFGGPQVQGQIDYVRPLGEKGPRLEAGAKALQRGFHGTYDYYFTDDSRLIREPGRSLGYTYHDLVSAAYVQGAHEIGKFSWQVGLRAEQTHARAALRDSGAVVSRDYLSFFPSATVNRKLGGEQEIQLAFSRRINRPDISQLLPLINYSDPRNIRVANPRLRPELVNALELGHQISWGGLTLSTTAFWRYTTQMIQRYRSVDTSQVVNTPDGRRTAVTRTIFVNIGHNSTTGLETSLSGSLTKRWRLTAFVSGFHYEVSTLDAGPANRANFSWMTRLNSNVTVLPKLDVQISGTYRSPAPTVQGLIQPQYGLDVALQQKLLHDRATLSVRVSDVFNTQVIDFQLEGPGLRNQTRLKRETRIGYLGFSYAFGDAKGRPQRRLNGSGGGGLG